MQNGCDAGGREMWQDCAAFSFILRGFSLDTGIKAKPNTYLKWLCFQAVVYGNGLVGGAVLRLIANAFAKQIFINWDILLFYASIHFQVNENKRS